MLTVLVWPPVARLLISDLLPLGLGYLKANTPNHEIVLVDSVVDKLSIEKTIRKIEKIGPDVIGISYWSFNTPLVKELISKFKKSLDKAIIIIGGPGPSASPRKSLELTGADFAIKGEGEPGFGKFLAVVMHNSEHNYEALLEIPGLVYRKENGEIVVNPQVMPELSEIKFPDYDFINLNDYSRHASHFGVHYPRRNQRVASIMTTRGCPYLCEFCSAREIHGKKVRMRPISSIIDEIHHLRKNYGITGINIIDDNWSFHMDFAKDVCRVIIKEGLNNLSYACPNGVRIEWLDKELLALMKKAGFYSIMVAPESGSLDTLNRMKKNIDLSIVANKVRMIRKAGIYTIGAFIVGYPGEKIGDVKKTIRFAQSIDFSMIAFHVFQPLPGTPIFQQLVEKKEIDEDFTTIDMQKVNYCPKDIPIKKFRRMVKIAYITSVLFSWQRLWFILRNGEILRIIRYAYHLLR